MFTKSDATQCVGCVVSGTMPFSGTAWSGPLFQESFIDVTGAVGPQRYSKKCINVRFFEYILEGDLISGEKEMIITQQIIVAAKFRLQNRYQRVILHKIYYFQPFLKF